MNKLYKIVSRQDANYKLSPSTSNETSINLSKDIANLLGNKTSFVSFLIYKEDFLKAIGAIAQIAPLYSRNDLMDINTDFPNLYEQINSQFGSSQESNYDVEFLVREDGRFYLRGLKSDNGFNLRSFLIESHSQLEFIKNDKGELCLRLNTSVNRDFPNSGLRKGIVSVDVANDVLNAFKQYFSNYLKLKSKSGENTDIERYFAPFKKLVGKPITENEECLSSVFQIISLPLLEKYVEEAIMRNNMLPLFKSQTWASEDNKNGKYEAWTLLRHYKAFLELFSASNSISNYLSQPNEGESSTTITMNNLPLQVIYYGAPGTGKSFTIDDMTDDENSVRTTFHPDSDYASFVGTYKPTMENVPINSIYGESVQFATGKNGHPGTEKKIVYKYVPQAFLKAYVAAWSNLDTPYYLIIEEINRGNCAQIFGDLFQLLDRNNSGSSSYAINADEDIAKFLREDVNGFASLSQEQRDAIAAYELVKDSGEKRSIGGKILDGKLLLLPHNLHIWATMNTSDQSLFPIDSAFKRRWNWKYVPIDTDPLDKRTHQHLNWKFEVAGNLYSWGKFLEFINPKIYDITESSDKQMGYFFAKADPTTGIISEEVFLNKVLFYLWTDVFKDYDVSSEIFKNKKENRSFRFTDFFEDAEALANFIENCKLESEEAEPQNAEEDAKLSTSRLNETTD